MQLYARKYRSPTVWEVGLANAARMVLARALRLGKVARPDGCGCCGVVGPVQGHHEDYSRPLDVVWLCRRCHALADVAVRVRCRAA